MDLTKQEVMNLLGSSLNDNFQIVNDLVGSNTATSATASYSVSNGGNTVGLSVTAGDITSAMQNAQTTTSVNYGSYGSSTANTVYYYDSSGNSGTWTTLTPLNFWQNYYYPLVIKESYPVYLQERAMDKGQKAFEIIKQLQDKGLLKCEKVKDFIDVMDALIKIL